MLFVWSEFEFDRDENSIDGQIANKFESEGINRYTKEYAIIVEEFKNETKNLAKVISSGERTIVNSYVDNICLNKNLS